MSYNIPPLNINDIAYSITYLIANADALEQVQKSSKIQYAINFLKTLPVASENEIIKILQQTLKKIPKAESLEELQDCQAHIDLHDIYMFHHPNIGMLEKQWEPYLTETEKQQTLIEKETLFELGDIGKTNIAIYFYYMVTNFQDIKEIQKSDIIQYLQDYIKAYYNNELRMFRHEVAGKSDIEYLELVINETLKSKTLEDFKKSSVYKKMNIDATMAIEMDVNFYDVYEINEILEKYKIRKNEQKHDNTRTIKKDRY